jgi:D-glycero-alpha-D-manno-heptose-7-phosphate kinase
MGYQLEAVELRLGGGRQDQYAAALGGWHELEFSSDSVSVQLIEPTQEQATELASMLVVAYTGESHFSSQTHSRVWSTFQAGDADTIDALQSIRDLGSEAGAALRAGDWPALARVVDENWRQQQRLDLTISTPAVQQVEQAARQNGAWGLKLTGAGAGGCLMAIVPPQAVERVCDAVTRAGARVLPAGFDFGGVQTWKEGGGESSIG